MQKHNKSLLFCMDHKEIKFETAKDIMKKQQQQKKKNQEKATQLSLMSCSARPFLGELLKLVAVVQKSTYKTLWRRF